MRSLALSAPRLQSPQRSERLSECFMFAVTQSHHCQSHWFVNNTVIHYTWIMGHPVHRYCIFVDGQGASVVIVVWFFFPPPAPPLNPPPPHPSGTPSSQQFGNNKRKAMCLAQILNSCLVCVSWGGCTSTLCPSIRPVHSPPTFRCKEDKYSAPEKPPSRWMDMKKSQIPEWLFKKQLQNNSVNNNLVLGN